MKFKNDHQFLIFLDAVFSQEWLEKNKEKFIQQVRNKAKEKEKKNLKRKGILYEK